MEDNNVLGIILKRAIFEQNAEIYEDEGVTGVITSVYKSYVKCEKEHTDRSTIKQDAIITTIDVLSDFMCHYRPILVDDAKKYDLAEMADALIGYLEELKNVLNNEVIR